VRTLRFGLVLTLTMGVGPLIMFAMGALGPALTVEFGLDRVELGLLSTVAYLVSAPICLAAGRILRVISPRHLLLATFALTALALVAFGLASSWWWLVVAAALSGVVQSFSNPTTNLLVSVAPTDRSRGTVMGVKQAGVQMAQLVAGLLPLAALLVHWRITVLAFVLVAVGGGVLTLTSVSREVGRGLRNGRTSRGLPRRAWWLFGYTFCTASSVMATNTYLPLFGVERLDLTPSVAGATMIIAGVLGMSGRIGWGRATDWIRRPSRALVVLALISLAGGALFGAASVTGVGWLLWAGVVCHGGGAVAANVVIIYALIECVRPDQVAGASGYQALAQCLGFALGPLLFGAVVEASESYVVGWIVVAAGYGVALAVARTALRSGDRHRLAMSK
jgi:predicted MFS family arabinose efflux permease